METIKISYEISRGAVKETFINDGIYYPGVDHGRWFEVYIKLYDISKEDRNLIWNTCKDVGTGDFIYERFCVRKVCHSANEFIEELRDNHPEIVVNTLDKFADYINSNEEWNTVSSKIIKKNGWTDETGETFGVCSDDKRRIILEDNGQAVVIEK